MIPNVNEKTGIRYGVIAIQELDFDVVDILMYGIQATDYTYEAACEEIRIAVAEEGWSEGEAEREIERRQEHLMIEEPQIGGEYEGVRYSISWLGGAPLLWVMEGPFTGYFQLCSPCVPGAVDLSSPSKKGAMGYDVPPSWRREDD